MTPTNYRAACATTKTLFPKLIARSFVMKVTGGYVTDVVKAEEKMAIYEVVVKEIKATMMGV